MFRELFGETVSPDADKKFQDDGRLRNLSKLARDHSVSTLARQMALSQPVKTTFEPRRVIQPIYTGGSVALSEDGRILATCLGEECLLTDLNTGEHLARIEGVSSRYPRPASRD